MKSISNFTVTRHQTSSRATPQPLQQHKRYADLAGSPVQMQRTAISSTKDNTEPAIHAWTLHQQLRYAVGSCSLGLLLTADSERGLCAIFLGDDAENLVTALAQRFPRAQLQPETGELQHVMTLVSALTERPAQTLNLALDIHGTTFQQRVWQVLREIPAGTTLSYTQVAQRLGAPAAARAVAQACAANPLAIVIPCHRVVRSDGTLSGYRWGVERKRQLLLREMGHYAPTLPQQTDCSMSTVTRGVAGTP